MRFDVLVADNEFNYLDDFKNYANEELRDIIISFSSNYKEIINNINHLDLIFLSTEMNNFEEIIDISIKNNTYIILMTNTQLDLFKESKYIDYLFKPINNKNLEYKIKHYINELKQEILLKQEKEISNSIINHITYPIFTTNGNKVIFANDYFYKLTNCKSLESINKKYLEIGDIFIEYENCFTNLNNDWLKKCKKETLNVCILNEEDENQFFALQQISLTHNNTNIILLKDISHEINHKKELDRILYTNNLTNLPNRAKLIKELQNNRTLVLTSICILDLFP